MSEVDDPRVAAAWLRLREPADAAARSGELVDVLRERLPHPDAGPLVVHDLGCGTGSMARWLAPRLAAGLTRHPRPDAGRQHWVLHDHDEDLLAVALAETASGTGDEVTCEVRADDVTRLCADDLRGASLVTASALLDVLTAAELDRLVATCLSLGCPVLLTLSVVGRVTLTPPDPLDAEVQEAFNAHQRRTTRGRALLGPDAVAAAVAAFTDAGAEVTVRSSPWRLDPGQRALTAAWLTGWVAAAQAQEPDLRQVITAYAGRRLAQATTGVLRAQVDHEDLLVWPGPRAR